MNYYINKDNLQKLVHNVDAADLPTDKDLIVYYKEDVDTLPTYTEIDIARAIIRKLKTNIKKECMDECGWVALKNVLRVIDEMDKNIKKGK